MFFRTLIAASCLSFALLTATTTAAAPQTNFLRASRDFHGGNTTLIKAAGDTIHLMGPTGSGAPYIGDFESGWNGWTSVDVTQPTVHHWQISDYNQVLAGNLAAWCGNAGIASCNDSLDVDGGYGNSWHDLMVFRKTVANPGANTTVTITATLQHDSEPAYDYVRLSTKSPGNTYFTDLQSWDGTATAMVNNTVTFLPDDLTDGTDVSVYFRFQSDGGWSDADCSFYGAGACQIDDITVTVSQAGQTDIVSFTDFQNGTYGDWAPTYPDGVGNFAALWTNLRDLDPCATNTSSQVAFIDDGLVVPGTGGSHCIDWCYGPSGYIVNTTGGLAGPNSHLDIELLSPQMAWPDASYDGISLAFDAYVHEDLSPDAPGLFFYWKIESTNTAKSAEPGAQDPNHQLMRDRYFVHWGGPEYRRYEYDVTNWMDPGRDLVQVSLTVLEMGWAWGWTGDDGYPAPYFDNVSVKVFPHVGPSMYVREIDLAQDNFPEIDEIDFINPGTMHVRFDAARNISPADHLRNDPGDSVTVDIVPARSGATLFGAPEMHYTIDANPTFGSFRTTAITGTVLGIPAVGTSGIPDPDGWAFDLPDTGTLFPGDVLHYYFRAADDVAGDIQYATLPADLTGYGDFSNPLAYNTSFVARALPTITSDGFGGYDVPNILFWNDFADRGGQEEWQFALQNSLGTSGTQYDIYYTNGPSSGVGNGIGGRTSGASLAQYSELIYTSGNLTALTLSTGDFALDAGNDIGALATWFGAGNKDLFLTGDNLASDLMFNAGGSGASFAETIMGVEVQNSSVRELIGNQASPLVLPVSGNSVFAEGDSWLAYSGCPGLTTFDAVAPRTGATRLAEFTDVNEQPGIFPYSAATLNVYNVSNRVISLPYDLMNVYTTPGTKQVSPPPARDVLLNHILTFFGASTLPPSAVDLPATAQFGLSSYPNPFNPATEISYTIESPGHLSLRIYNLRGQLVRTLVDSDVQSGGQVMWDGTDDRGKQVASGVYFREARMGDQVRIGKMALIK